MSQVEDDKIIDFLTSPDYPEKVADFGVKLWAGEMSADMRALAPATQAQQIAGTLIFNLDENRETDPEDQIINLSIVSALLLSLPSHLRDQVQVEASAVITGAKDSKSDIQNLDQVRKRLEILLDRLSQLVQADQSR